jgi:hypothetical protein
VAATPHDFIDNSKEFANIERLGEITVSAGSQETLNLAGGGVRADNHNRDIAREFILPQTRQNFVSVNVGQMEIE